MSTFSEKYKYNTTPIANPKAIIKGDKYRFTVLSKGLIRIEYDDEGIFEDAATQNVINRDFPLPEFEYSNKDGVLKIETSQFVLTYFTDLPFTDQSINIRSKELNNYNNLFFVFWDDPNLPNETLNTNNVMKNLNDMADISGNTMKGTASRLDNFSGPCELSEGIVSRNCAVLNDAGSMVFTEDGFVKKRRKEIDRYIFMYPNDYLTALKDFCTLTGKTPMIPRYALGNWWSKYHKYTQEEYVSLVDKFEEKNIPFSMLVLDMDWHVTDIPPKNGSGWGGYTWNKELFPDYKTMLSQFHKKGYHIALNVHPGTGVTPVDDAYKDMAKVQNFNISSGDTIPIDISSPELLEKFFELLYHPNEEDGVDFWWVDGFAKNFSKNYGLDYLWMSSHYYYLDNCKKNNRGLSFYRCTAGAATHRYPIGFSGDAFSTWEMLDFQPYFTATASNVAFGWWSHDIGGFRDGIRDEELMVRWVQFGVFSPINRLHCNQSIFNSREPWNYGKENEEIICDFLRLRHKFIPYTYTMNYISYKNDISLIRPLYYFNSSNEEAYQYKNTYYFGSEMIVAPITKPADKVTNLGKVTTWLPSGLWYDFFSGLEYTGDTVRTYYRNKNTLPVFVKAGGIVVLDANDNGNNISNPETLEVNVFPSASNTFTLYEDDGITQNYMSDDCLKTNFELVWSNKPTFIIHKPEGNREFISEHRVYLVKFRGLKKCEDISVKVNGKDIPFITKYENGNIVIQVDDHDEDIIISFNKGVETNERDVLGEIYNLLYPMNAEISVKEDIFTEISTNKTLMDHVSYFENYKNLDNNIKMAIYEILR